MNTETKVCQNCKVQFTIEPEDFDFYKKMDTPPPTWCSECRMIRRFAFTDIWSLYKRACAKCGKGVLTMYSPDKQKTVYCMPCWWADDWDGTEYGMDYDPSRPFLAQLIELNKKTPYQALEAAYLTNKGCEYCNAVGHCKDSYLIFWADYCENAYYSTFLNGLKDSLDCYRMSESELCYEDVGCDKCYHAFFSEECDSCTDVWFSRSCAGCMNCFGCINLRNKNYCIWNEQYTKEEYLKKLQEMNLRSRASLEAMKKQVQEFWLKHPRRSYVGNSLNVGVTGDYIYESKNAKDAYMVTGVEDSRYVQFVSVSKVRDVYDYSGWGNGGEKIYEAAVVGEGGNNVKYSFECWPEALDNQYSIYAISSKHVFGCLNLKRKDYCILNKQYSKEEYEKLVAQIREDMIRHPYVDAQGRTWSYGEFLPLELAAFGYNESLADLYFPKTKDQSLKEGFAWYEGETSRPAITKQGDEVADMISATDDSILNETIGCSQCGRAFRFIPGEMSLMRRLELPLPTQCQNCRQRARLTRSNLPRLYDRVCVKCNKAIRTSYALDRPEIVYCEQCYNSEIA
jgi:hypothetical protein